MWSKRQVQSYSVFSFTMQSLSNRRWLATIANVNGFNCGLMQTQIAHAQID